MLARPSEPISSKEPNAMITRRQTLQIAAAFAATRGALFAVSPDQAAAMLDSSAAGDDPPVDWRDLADGQETLNDPIAFAIDLDSTDYRWGGGYVNGAAPEWAAYKRALDRVIAAVPEALAWKIDNPANDLDEIVVAMGNAMWRAGVVAGAAYEHLRLAVTAPDIVCRCNGQDPMRRPQARGALRDDGHW
jgi:hypothetical protein